MNFQSDELCTLMLGKLVALARVHPSSLEIGGAVNFTLSEFPELRIGSAGASLIGNCDWRGFGLARGQAGNWSRSEFPALKIETVENGSIQ